VYQLLAHRHIDNFPIRMRNVGLHHLTKLSNVYCKATKLNIEILTLYEYEVARRNVIYSVIERDRITDLPSAPLD
jgi:hypothetical protein